jgi:hypothetical protein
MIQICDIPANDKDEPPNNELKFFQVHGWFKQLLGEVGSMEVERTLNASVDQTLCNVFGRFFRRRVMVTKHELVRKALEGLATYKDVHWFLTMISVRDGEDVTWGPSLDFLSTLCSPEMAGMGNEVVSNFPKARDRVIETIHFAQGKERPLELYQLKDGLRVLERENDLMGYPYSFAYNMSLVFPGVLSGKGKRKLSEEVWQMISLFGRVESANNNALSVLSKKVKPVTDLLNLAKPLAEFSVQVPNWKAADAFLVKLIELVDKGVLKKQEGLFFSCDMPGADSARPEVFQLNLSAVEQTTRGLLGCISEVASARLSELFQNAENRKQKGKGVNVQFLNVSGRDMAEVDVTSELLKKVQKWIGIPGGKLSSIGEVHAYIEPLQEILEDLQVK